MNKKRTLPLIIFLAFISFITHAQPGIGIQLNGTVLPKAKITVSEGNYRLQSRLQSCFSIGVNNHTNPQNAWDISTGLHFELTNWNFFLHIPDTDLDGYYSTGGAPQIENKEVDFALSLPVRVIHNFHFNDKGFMSVSAGFKLTYNGFTEGESITTSMADTSNQLTTIFYGEFKNQKNPWISLLAGISKNFYLKNSNLLAIEMVFEASGDSNIKGDYAITVPSKPVTRGTYAVSRLRAGLSIEYVFTGKRKHKRERRS